MEEFVCVWGEALVCVGVCVFVFKIRQTLEKIKGKIKRLYGIKSVTFILKLVFAIFDSPLCH